MDYNKILNKFIPGFSATEVEPFGNGFINDTFKVSDSNESYILQSINTAVFPDVEGLMNNINRATAQIKSKGHQSLTFIPTETGRFFLEEDGKTWRMMHFEEGTQSFELATSTDMAEDAGVCLAEFQEDLAGLSPQDFVEIIPRFHDVAYRLDQLDEAVANNAANRLEECKELLDYANSLRKEMIAFYEKGLPLRIVHNDTKLNNILFDKQAKPYCMVDLDTIMPGYIHYDFGDVVRTMCNLAKEDEQDLSKIKFSQDLYNAFKKGYLSKAGDFLTPEELEYIDFSGKYMTYLMAIRPLADYLNGDVYYKISYPTHNLAKAKSQFQYLKQLYAAL